MATITELFEENGWFNKSGDAIITYYDTVIKDFVFKSAYEKNIPSTLIEAPYKGSFSRAVWSYFYNHLTDEQRALKEAFDEPHGFFDYMHETGLYEAYEAAYNYVAERVLENWQEDNSITINVA